MDKFPYGALSDGREVTAYRLRNANGCELVVLDYGVTLVSLTMPDRGGKLVDVILGYDTAKEYEENGGFFGACIGRVCNRIGGSSFTLDGVKYDLVKDEVVPGTKRIIINKGIRPEEKPTWCEGPRRKTKSSGSSGAMTESAGTQSAATKTRRS